MNDRLLKGCQGVGCVAPLLILLAACGGGRGGLPSASGGSLGSAGAGGRGAGGAEAACIGPADPRLVVAPQRILLLTLPQVVSTVGYLLGDAAAEMVRSSPAVGVGATSDREFPPGTDYEARISAAAVISRDQVGQIVGQYVLQNFGGVTKCVPATDACALNFLDVIAARAYRREPTPDERTALRELYSVLREQQVNGYQVTATVEEATQHALYALVTSPQLLWRYEVGAPAAAAATSPSGVSLSDDELASAISFFLTDRPPDDALRAAARTGTLHATLAQHVARILDTEAAHSWLRSVMEIYFQLNKLPVAGSDSASVVTDALLADMQNESRLFLDETLWHGDLGDLVASRATFLNTRLAMTIYGIPVPPGATDTDFVRTMLPSDQRAGLLTNAGFLTMLGKRFVLRGNRAAAAFLCVPPPAPPPFLNEPGPVADEEAAQIAKVATTTTQQQVVARRKPECLTCHATMDSLGVALDAYDGVGRYRTVDERGQPIDTHTPLPPVLGNGTVDGAVAMAETIARSPAFADCMARVVLWHALADLPSPLPACATADVAARFSGGSDKTFGALVRAAAASPAFVLRSPAP